MAEPEDEAEEPKKEQLALNFGKKLAHTDKRIRDKGFRNLRGWLRKHVDLERLDYLKLWRSLYFGFWMSDKRPVQQELAVQMALLINDIPRAKQGMWIDTFWETMQVSWEKLDTHRVSKYLLCIRIVVAEAFKVLRLGGWQESEVAALGETFLRQVPRNAKNGVNAPSVGLNLQFNRLLWDELRPQLGNSPEPSVETIMTLLEPFCAVAEGSGLGSLVRSIHQYVLLRVPPQFTGKMIFRLLQGAARKDISKANREALYETVDKLEKGTQAVLAAASSDKPSGQKRGAPEATPEPAAAAAEGAAQAPPMKKKKKRPKSTG